MSANEEKRVRFDMDRKTELRQRIASHLAMRIPAGRKRLTWKDALSPEEIHKLVRNFRSLQHPTSRAP